ncbi:hypothetical protein PMAYCL1PPCAC_09231, partial [Pristionchus mayeri]
CLYRIDFIYFLSVLRFSFFLMCSTQKYPFFLIDSQIEMTSDVTILGVTRKEQLPKDTDIFRTDDGAFYWCKSSTERLYVKSNGKKIDAKRPGNNIWDIAAHGNALYFTTLFTDKEYGVIYKATYTPSDANPAIAVSHVRDMIKDEEIHNSGSCCRLRHGKRYVYRMWEDPNSYGTIIDLPEDMLKDLDLKGVHMGKAIYTNKIDLSDKSRPTVIKLSEKVIVIEARKKLLMYTNDSYPFIYCWDDDNYIYVLDTNTMELGTPLQLEGFRINFITDVRNGEITVNGWIGHVRHCVIAQLPKEYKQEDERNLKSTIDEQIKQMGALQAGNSKLGKEVVQLQSTVKDQSERIQVLQSENDKLCDGLRAIQELKSQNEQLKLRCDQMEHMMRETKIGALQSAKRSLKFVESEKLSKPLICIQLENGTILYFDNVKPFEIFTIVDGARITADLKSLEGEFDFSFRGTVGNIAYFCSIRGKQIKFFKVEFENQKLRIEHINEMKNSEISLINNQPYYLIELGREWSIYQYYEDHNDTEGKQFTISEIKYLSKYERKYHKGVLYLFREHSQASIEKVNENIVIVEGPLLDPDYVSIYIPSHSDCIYILNMQQNLLIVLDTTNLTVSQITYEPTSDSTNHSIVGINDGVLTMAFDGVWGRHLATTRMP